MAQPRKLLVAILVSSLVTNAILLGTMAASLWAVYSVKDQVCDVYEQLERVHQVVRELKAIRERARERIRQSRTDDASAEDRPTTRLRDRAGPLQRLRGDN